MLCKVQEDLNEAQEEKWNFLSNNVQNLNNVLTDKKTRGIFGEVQLYQVLSSAFGNNTEIYQKQYKLSNGTMLMRYYLLQNLWEQYGDRQ